ncbi:hypothetical protein [Sutterella sp.]|uniref:hypothetical protein n=1 Tax=Sutterella sp. TaxID=1981025 RepID=UPI0026E0CDBD|nr:hypothetical protein [Sutterella sp.]MDO5532907.1 hypothetical protein [Sutterella sp.]
MQFIAECIASQVMRRFRAGFDRLPDGVDPQTAGHWRKLDRLYYFEASEYLGTLSDADFEKFAEEFRKLP